MSFDSKLSSEQDGYELSWPCQDGYGFPLQTTYHILCNKMWNFYKIKHIKKSQKSETFHFDFHRAQTTNWQNFYLQKDIAGLCQSCWLHKVQLRAQRVLHLNRFGQFDILNKAFKFQGYFVLHMLSQLAKETSYQPWQLAIEELAERILPCSTTARIPSSEQIIVGKIREETFPTFEDFA